MKTTLAILQSPELRAICIASFVLNIGYGMITPILPIYANWLGLPTLIIGAMFGIFAFTKLISNTPGGVLSDIYSDKRILLFSLLLFTVATFLFTLTDNPYLFLIFRGLEGLAAGLATPTLYSIINRSVASKTRGEAIGTLVAFSTAGSALGPMSGGFTVPFLGYKSIFYFTSLLALGAALIVQIGIPPRQFEVSTKSSLLTAFQNEFQALDRGKLAKSIYGIGVLAFFLDFIFGVVESIGPLYMHNYLGASISEVGTFFFINFIIFAVFSPISGKMVDILGAKRQAIIAMLGITLILPCTLLATSYYQFLVIFIGEFFMATLLFPAIMVLASRISPDETRSGKVFGLLNTIRASGLIAGPILGAALYQTIPHLIFPLFGFISLFCLGIFLSLFMEAQGDSTDEQHQLVPQKSNKSKTL